MNENSLSLVLLLGACTAHHTINAMQPNYDKQNSMPNLFKIVDKLQKLNITNDMFNWAEIISKNKNDNDIFQLMEACKVNYKQTMIPHFAAAHARQELLELILPKISINHNDQHGESPIFYAILACDPNMIIFLHKHEADLNHKNFKGTSPLKDAQNSLKSIINTYQDATDKDAANSEINALHAIIQYLIDNGAKE